MVWVNDEFFVLIIDRHGRFFDDYCYKEVIAGGQLRSKLPEERSRDVAQGKEYSGSLRSTGSQKDQWITERNH